VELNILRSGAKARAKLDKLQAEIAVNAIELAAAEGAPVSIEEARTRLNNALEWPVQQAALAFESLLVRTPGHVQLPTAMGVGEWAYLQGADAFVESILVRIAGKAGVPAEKRAEHINALRQTLLRLQIAEEHEVLDLERCGHTVLRRSNADLTVLLEVWSESAPAP
jgi:hypothetical protein